MLLVRLHWHNAFQQAPYREARLLAFASGTPNNANSNDAQDKPEVEQLLDFQRSFRDLRRKFVDIVAFSRGEHGNAMLSKATQDDQDILNGRAFVINRFHHLETMADALIQWQRGSITPAQLKGLLETHFAEEWFLQDALSAIDSTATDPHFANSINQWNNGTLNNQARKEEIIEHIWEAAELYAYEDTATHTRAFFAPRIDQLERLKQSVLNELPEDIRTLQKRTRGEIWELMKEHGPEDVPHPEEMKKALEDGTKFGEIRTKLENIQSLITGRGREALLEKAKNVNRDLVNLLPTMVEDARFFEQNSRLLMQWWRGMHTPKEFRDSLEEYLEDEPNFAYLLIQWDAAIADPRYAGSINQWNNNALEDWDQKAKIISHLWKASDFKEFTDLIKKKMGHLQEWKDAVVEMETELLKEKEKEDEKRVATHAKEALAVRGIVEAFETMQKQLQNISTLRRDPELVRALVGSFTPEQRKEIEAAVHLIDIQSEMLLQLEDYAAHFADWKDKKITPAEFRIFLERYVQDPANRSDILSAFDSCIEDDSIKENVKLWNTDPQLCNDSSKTEIIQIVWDGIDGNRIQKEFQDYVQNWADYITNVEAVFIKLEEVKNDKLDELQEEQERRKRAAQAQGEIGIFQRLANLRVNGAMGIALYSPREIHLAFKRVKDAFDAARKDFEQQQANKLAAEVAHTMKKALLPYGDAVDAQLTHTLESDFNKALNDYKADLGDDDFKTLIAKLKENVLDKPKAMAVIEMAAEHGWLYDLTDLKKADKWPIEIYGIDFNDIAPDHWDEKRRRNKISSLARKNTSGGQEEREKGKNRVAEQQDPAIYRRKFEEALNAHNYQSAFGIADAFIGRGKEHDADTYITVTLIDHIRNNPDASKYLNASLLEQFSIMRWGQATASMNNIAYQMKEMKKLLKDHSSMEGYFLATIQGLYNEVSTVISGETEELKEQKRRLVARIMTGETVKEKGHVFTLFKEEYRSFWDGEYNIFMRDLKGDEILKTEGDYLTPTSNSAFILASKKSVSSILHTGNSGQFDRESVSKAFIQRVVSKFDELEASGATDAANIFCEVTRKKLEYGFSANFNANAPNMLIRSHIDNGEHMFGALIKRGLLTKDFLMKLAGSKAKDGFEEGLDQGAAAPRLPPPAPPAKKGSPNGH